MRSRLAKAGYKHNPENRVWSRPGYGGIDYSDGEEVEQRIAAIIAQATDITVLSSELRGSCSDWPSLYHLSSSRANILRPFQDSLKGTQLLEIGAGCGAITRYLGECGADVLALEGAPARASIARSRTRDLANVTVVADSFDRFQWEQKFDIITLIGVLEYANLFMPGEHPARTMLQRVNALLKPDGRVIIAIENQLGLKYFAGAPEDHLGQTMYGIEGRYRKEQPQTFGRKQLSDLLTSAGFSQTRFFAPFPDYKLPSSIITESGANTDGFDAAALAWQSVCQDYQLPADSTFSLELAWGEIFNNGLAMELANSFLVLAGSSVENGEPSDSILAFHYSTERRPCFCKETRFVVDGERRVVVEPHALYTPVVWTLPDDDMRLGWSQPGKSNYIGGHLLAQDFIKIVTTPGWDIQLVAAFLKNYLDILCHLLRITSVTFDNPENLLPGEFLDAVPFNIVKSADGRATLIDSEWTAEDGVELGYLLFRTMTSLIGHVAHFSLPKDKTLRTRRHLIERALNEVGLPVSEEKLFKYLENEACLHIFSSGLENTRFDISLLDQELPGLNRAKMNRQLQEQLALMAEAKGIAEHLALARLSELETLHERLIRTDEAKDTAERLALERLSELQDIQLTKI